MVPAGPEDLHPAESVRRRRPRSGTRGEAADFEADAAFDAKIKEDADSAFALFAEAFGKSASAAGLSQDKTKFTDGLQGQPAGDRFRTAWSLFGGARGLSAPDDDLRYEPRVERKEVLTP
ncbi:hypothetical protein ACFQ2B_02720 [Streptomyces stramineus]